MLDLLLHNPNVQKVWTAQLLSLVGDWAAILALSGLFLDRTGSIAQAALPIAAVPVGLIIGSFVAHVGDMLPRKTILILTDIVRALIYLLLAVWNGPTIAILLLLVLSGVMSALFAGARGAIWQDIVPIKQLQAVRSLSLITLTIAMAVGAVVGTSLWQSVGAPKALAFNAGTYGISALLLLLVRAPLPMHTKNRPAMLDGWRIILGTPFLRQVISVTVLGSMAINAVERLTVSYAHDRLHNSDAMWLSVAVAIGAFLSMLAITKLVVPHFGKPGAEKQQAAQRLRLGIQIEIVVYVLALVLAQLPSNRISSVVLFLCVGAFSCYGPLIQPAAIHFIPRMKQASAFAALEVSSQLSVLVGTGIAAILLAHYDIRVVFSWLFGVSAVYLMIVGLISTLSGPDKA